MNTQALMQLITDLGAFGFILYLVHRTQTYTIPRLTSSFELAVEKQRVDFKDMIALQRSDFERMSIREQEVHAVLADKVIKAIEEVAREVRH